MNHDVGRKKKNRSLIRQRRPTAAAIIDIANNNSRNNINNTPTGTTNATTAAATSTATAISQNKNKNKNNKVQYKNNDNNKNKSKNKKRKLVETTTKTKETTTSHSNSLKKPKARTSKQQQPPPQQQGINLPDIPGVPIEIVPLMVHALQVTTKFFNQSKQSIVSLQQDEEDEKATTTAAAGATSDNSTTAKKDGQIILNRIFDRLEQDNNDTNKQQQQQKAFVEKRNQMKNAIQAWLQAMKQYMDHYTSRSKQIIMRKIKQQQEEDDNDEEENNGKDLDRRNNNNSCNNNIPLKSLEYLWKLNQDHPKFKVKRSSTYLCGKLLEKSKDCRTFLFDNDDTLWSWIQLVTSSSSHATSKEVELWQKESTLLVSHLLSKGYYKFYPKLVVAEQCMQQQLLGSGILLNNYYQWNHSNNNDDKDDDDDNTPLNNNETKTTTTMMDYRHRRDMALQYGEEEIRRVQKILYRAYNCIDILVPRFIINDKTAVKGNVRNDKDDEDNGDGDDDDSIDWEDGADDDDDDESINNNNDDDTDENNNAESHAERVERTLELMQTVGTLREFSTTYSNNPMDNTSSGYTGGMEINLGHSNGSGGTVDTKEKQKACQQLQKCIRQLQKRHVFRLDGWEEALQKADMLQEYQQAPNNSDETTTTTAYRSLVVMPDISKRETMYQQLSQLKKKISSIMASGKKLGIGGLKGY